MSASILTYWHGRKIKKLFTGRLRSFVSGGCLKEDAQLPGGSVAKDGEKHISFTNSEALAKLLKETDDEDYPCLAKVIKQPFGDKGNSFYTIADPDN